MIVPTVEATRAPTIVQPTAAATLATGKPADAKTAILAALDALDKNGPYRMTISASNDAEGPVILEVVPPDRSHYKASLNGTPVEVIDIGTTSYVLNPDGSWETGSTTDTGASGSGIDLPNADTLTNARLLPPENLNGIATTVYSFIDSTSPEVTVTLCVTQDKGLPVQILTTSSDDVVIYTIEYDTTITVVAPVK